MVKSAPGCKISGQVNSLRKQIIHIDTYHIYIYCNPSPRKLIKIFVNNLYYIILYYTALECLKSLRLTGPCVSRCTLLHDVCPAANYQFSASAAVWASASILVRKSCTLASLTDASNLMWHSGSTKTAAEAMGAFSLVLGILQYVGLYAQLNAALNVGEADNHISGHG